MSDKDLDSVSGADAPAASPYFLTLEAMRIAGYRSPECWSRIRTAGFGPPSISMGRHNLIPRLGLFKWIDAGGAKGARERQAAEAANAEAAKKRGRAKAKVRS